MADENPQSSGMQIVGDINMRIKDLEEKQRMQKERLLLIGENLVEIKESVDGKILEIKKDIEMLKQNIERMTSFLESASREFSKFAKKEDLDILSKQAKMFQPLDFVRKKDLEKSQR
jgi:predicted  nucleic acid-binding Zn-ribbon protein